MGKVRPVENKFIETLNIWTKEYLPNSRGLSKNTIKSYQESWTQMIDYFYMVKGIPADKIQFDDLTFGSIIGFLDWIQKEKECRDSTRNSRLGAIRSFAKYAQNKDYHSATVFYVEAMKVPFKKPGDSITREAMTQEEIGLIINLPSPSDTYGYRDRTILTILYATACRGQELCDLRVKDVRFKSDGKASVKLTGKGNKTRMVRISEKPASTLKSFMNRQGISNQPDRYIFTTQSKCQMTVNCLEKIVKKYARVAKERYPKKFNIAITPHVFRHSTATHMINEGVPLIVISRFLGHEYLATTEIYAKLSPSSVNEKLKEWDKKYWEKYMDEPLLEEPENEMTDLEKNRLKLFK